MFQKVKTQNIRVRRKEGFFGGEAADREDGGPSGTSNPSSESTEFTFFYVKGRGMRGARGD